MLLKVLMLLNMTQETTNNPQNDHTMTAEKSDEKLLTSTDPVNNKFVSSDVDNCINKISKTRMLKKHCNNLRKLQTDY